MDKYKKAHVQTSQCRVFLSTTVVYTTPVLTILSKICQPIWALVWWCCDLLCSASILQQSPAEPVTVCGCLAGPGAAGAARRDGQRPCPPPALGQRGAGAPRMLGGAPASRTESSCFFQQGAVGPNSVRTDLVLNFCEKRWDPDKKWIIFWSFSPPVHSYWFKACPQFQESSDTHPVFKTLQL